MINLNNNEINIIAGSHSACVLPEQYEEYKDFFKHELKCNETCFDYEVLCCGDVASYDKFETKEITWTKCYFPDVNGEPGLVLVSQLIVGRK